MAFNVRNFGLISGGFGTSTTQEFGYRSTDTKTVILASGYFNEKRSTLNVGDRVVLTADTGGTLDSVDIYVATNDGTTVTTAEVTDAADISLAEGNILVGNSSGDAVPFDASGSDKVLFGNATTLVSNAVTGDIALPSTGIAAISAGVIVNADISTSAAIGVPKLEGLASGELVMGVDGTSANNTKVVMSGDGTLSNAGVFAYAADSIINADVKSDAAIAVTKLEGLASAEVLVGVDGTGANNAKVTLSSDVTMTNAGVVTIANDAVTQAKLDTTVIRDSSATTMPLKLTKAIWAVNTHAKVRLVSGFAVLSKNASATSTYTVKITNATGAVDMTDTLTFTDSDGLGFVRSFTPVTAGAADELDKAEALEATTAGTTSSGVINIFLDWEGID